MRNIRLAVVAAIIMALTLAGSAWAQRGMGSGFGYGRIYNPQTVENVSGQVVSVDTMSRGDYQGVHLTVKTDKETIAVHLGPSWYLDQQKMIFAPKDTVEITGSRVTFDGKPAIIAAEVKKGGQSLKLRDATGIPLWAGQGRRR
ncbi:MAG: DNA-binding protein [Syntrophales bacterium]|nr:DNA-binding protein [Syntrophales bacterium]MDD5640362.1 DNA-binding protein [Syntrophales bacterium]